MLRQYVQFISQGMCKRHWRAVNFPDASKQLPGPPGASAAAAAATVAGLAQDTAKNELHEPPPPEGTSVYETILPASIAYRPTVITATASPAKADFAGGASPAASAGGTGTSAMYAGIMPLVAHLRDGAMKHPVGWHRNAERRARGMWPVTSLSTQLEPWERQLALVEILLLSGGTPNANFKDLAHAWGREKGFHNVLASSVCERRGEVERKRRSDAGKSLTQEERASFNAKVKKTRQLKNNQEVGPESEAAAGVTEQGAELRYETVPPQQDGQEQQPKQLIDPATNSTLFAAVRDDVSLEGDASLQTFQT
jgi:hypothetical protein